MSTMCSACALRAQFYFSVRQGHESAGKLLTSVDAVQPSGNIQLLGLDPWIRQGYYRSVDMRAQGRRERTSIVKQ
jgi:hypothetical protein